MHASPPGTFETKRRNRRNVFGNKGKMTVTAKVDQLHSRNFLAPVSATSHSKKKKKRLSTLASERIAIDKKGDRDAIGVEVPDHYKRNNPVQQKHF